ncbi:MAG: DNA internalization-related competence protein ComEC/Rec2 [Deltaproteobacteria bacterium]|nr:DNA internalization-related competence protein ComEC/Rec2 [Deltaproteobacteria bacterium]
MSERPLLIPLFSLVAGISAANQWHISLPGPFLCLLLATCLLAVFCSRRVLFPICLSLCFFVAGATAMAPILVPRFSSDSIVRFAGEQEPLVIEGIIDARPEWQETGGRVYLRAVRVFLGKSEQPVSGRILLYVGTGQATLSTGDLVRFSSRISRPRNFGIPGEFDYERYLAFRKVYVTAFSRSAAEVVLIRGGVAFPVQNLMDRLAADLGNRIGVLLPCEEGAVLRALLLGESGLVPESTRELYARTGVNHILSISGFHVGVVGSFFFFLVFCTARFSEFLLLHVNLRRTILVLTLPVLLFYLLLTGGAPATVRSVIMISASFAAVLLQRESDPIHSLMLAALLILGWSPSALFDISFQLSFLALWGILALTPLLMQPFRNIKGGMVHKFLLFLMVSLAAAAATLIPVAGYFHTPTLTGLPANIFIIPLMGYGGVVLGVSSLPFLHFLPSVAGFLLMLAGFMVYLSGRILSCLAAIPLLPVWGGSRFDLLLLVVFLLSITFLVRRPRIICCCLTIAAFFLIRIAPAESFHGKLRLDFFSVGQGEASLITFPNGKRMLVDGGGSFREGGLDTGERLLAPAFWLKGIDRLDYMVLTHSHPDHLNGLLFLARSFPVGEFWESGIHDGNREYLALKKILKEKGVPVRRIDGSSQPISVGEVIIEPLFPRKTLAVAGTASGGTLNDESLVFRMRLGEFSILFTGDIGQETENRLAEETSELRCTVLKASHHGSRTSSSESFLSATSPKCVLVSAGYGNRFHLPAKETLRRFQQRGLPIYRTDLDGTITVTLEEGRWSVVTFRGDRHFH